jgi:hypothetical protein
MSGTVPASDSGQIWHVDGGTTESLLEDIGVGDEIQAWHNGKIYIQGMVLSLIPSLDLITLKCGRTGAARLIDAGVLQITSASPLLQAENPNAHPAVAGGRVVEVCGSQGED